MRREMCATTRSVGSGKGSGITRVLYGEKKRSSFPIGLVRDRGGARGSRVATTRLKIVLLGVRVLVSRLA